MKKRTRMARVWGLLCLSLAVFACEEQPRVEPMPDYETILTSHDWIVTNALYHQPQNLSDLLLDPLKDHLHLKVDYTNTTNVYSLLEKSFPCILDNTFRFDKGTHTLTINTGYQPCVGNDPFTNYLIYNEFPKDDLSENDWYTVSFLPTGSRSTWSVNPEKREMYIRENPNKLFPDYSSVVWTIKEASPNQIVVETLFGFGYAQKAGNSYQEQFRSSRITLTLSPVR